MRGLSGSLVVHLAHDVEEDPGNRLGVLLGEQEAAVSGRGEPVSLIGVRLHILVAGGRFDIATREAAPE